MISRLLSCTAITALLAAVLLATGSPPSSAADGPTVLSAGNIALTPKLSGISADGTDFDSFELGLLDKTGAYADQTWHSATDTVLHLGAGEYDAGTGSWSTPAKVDDVASYTTGDQARVLFGLDVAGAKDGMNYANKAAIAGSPQPSFTLKGATVPDGGRFRLTGPTGTTAWDTALLDGGGSQVPQAVPYLNGGTYRATSFTAPGTYCLTVSETMTSKGSAQARTSAAAVTVVVGDLPDTLTVCDQPGGDDGGDDGGSGGDDSGPMVLTQGHLDTRAWLNAKGDGLDVGIVPGIGDPLLDGKFVDSSDFVMTGLMPGTVPATTPDADYTFLGDPGSHYWYWPESQASGYLWPGFSTENWKQNQLGGSRTVNLTLSGVDGPGDVVVYRSGAAPLDILYDTKWGTPASYSFFVPAHVHAYWAFSAQGRYCLNMNASTELADGSWIRGSGMLTVWVGDPAEAKNVTPCDRDTSVTPPVDTAPPAHATPAESAVLFAGDNNEMDIAPQFTSDGAADAPAYLHPSLSAAGQYRDLDDVVVSYSHTIRDDVWQPNTYQMVKLSTDRLPWGSMDGQLKVSLGDVRGPGTAAFRTGDNPTELTQQSGMKNDLALFVSKPGVYCVPLTFSMTRAGRSSPVSTTRTLTIAAGDTDPTDSSYIDRSKITTCSRGQQPFGVGDSSGGGDEPEWNVPNESLTDSGAVILNDGHVDVASKVNGSTLETWVKDTTESSDARYHPLTGSNSLSSSERNSTDNGNGTVFQLLPGARTTVPEASQYAFLGAANSPVWQVAETQETGLLWPGWSTEEIPLSATKTGVRWTLDKVAGPGEFALYTSSPTDLNGVDVLYNTRDGVTAADSYTIPQNAHVHGSWAFSAEGVYCLAFTRSTTLASGAKASDDFTLAVAVGEVDVKKVDPGECFTSTGEPGTQDVNPVPDSQLTDATSGGVQVLGDEDGFSPGQLVTVQVGKEYQGRWVSVWLHSPATWLGWAQVGTSGAVQVRLPADATPGTHKLVVKTEAGQLLGWDALALVEPPDTGGGGGDGGGSGGPGDAPDPGSPTCKATATIISSGHLDYSAQVIGGKLRSLIGDNSSGTEVFREPSKTVLWLKPSSKVTLPAGFEQIGTAGSSVYMVPQTQNTDLIWLGWSTETLDSAKVSGPVTWKLTDVDGPGTAEVFLNGEFGGVQSLVFDGPSTYHIPLGVHAHANWAFSEQGVYRLRFTQTATLKGGKTSSDSQVLTVVVGDVDPATAVPGGKQCTGATPPADTGGTSSSTGSPDTGATGTAARCTPARTTVISAGHLDYGAHVVGGKLESLIGDDSSGTRVYREPSRTVLWLKPAAKVTLPAGFGQVGAAGSTVWQVPQTQNMSLIWLGWSTELLNAGNAAGPVTWKLTAIDGPGTVKVYTTGSFGGVEDMVFDGTGSHRIALGVHAHANWAFSKQGVYRLHFTQSVTLKNGKTSSDSEVLTLAVGDVDPAEVTTGASGCGVVSTAARTGGDTLPDAKKAAEQLQAQANRAAAGQLPGHRTPTAADGTSAASDRGPVPLLLGILGGLLLLGAAGGGALWRRRRKWEGAARQAPAAQ
ncbi:TIGR03773 family transporter-associated surface protein [Streptomyces sp. NPDC021020]|uniref:TIGR03773 family transporter-associated surface protein n=1 Tax=Streptomyces sp. NPDC021020 TaxID=3365109 RepID=UPI00378E5A44